ncbi:MAG: hypothetical protein ACTJG2_03670 [Candidatus Saccharimonadales bacterium]
MKQKKLFIIGGVVAALSVALFGGADAQAQWQTDNIIDERDTSASAEQRLSAICSGSTGATLANRRAGHAGWLGSAQVTPNENGEFELDLYMKYRRCSGDVRKYAITGYPPTDISGISDLSFCDNVGTYGNHMKYERDSWYVGIWPFGHREYGPWEWRIKSGPSSGSRTAANTGDYTYDCVKYMGNDQYHKDRFNSARFGSAAGFEQNIELTGTTVRGPIKRTISGKIANWSQRRETAGRETINLTSLLCSFYKNSDNRLFANLHCQTIRFDVIWGGEYSLTPTVSVDTKSVVDGENPNITGINATIQNDTVENSSTTRANTSRFIVKKADRTAAIDTNLSNTGTSSSANPDTAAREYIEAQFRGQDYQLVANPAARVFPTGTTSLLDDGSEAISAPLEAGDRICYITSVQRPTYNHSANDWLHSAAACVAVGSRPHVQVRSGDLFVGGKIITGNTSRQAGAERRTYGSWSEYGAVVGNSVRGFGSGSIYRMGMQQGRSNLGFLTFANVPNPGRFGTVTDGSSTLAEFFAAMPAEGRTVSGTDPLLDLASLPEGRHVIRPTGNIRVQGALAENRSVIILMRPNATARVVGNVATPEAASSLGRLSQLVIAPASNNSNFNIHVSPGATRVDSWMIAPEGRIDTCNANVAPTPRTAPHKGDGGCGNNLFVNGPVAARAILLGRAGGQDRADGAPVQSVPAESFNLRPDAYLWVAQQVNSSGARYVTTQSVDLPPRY